MATFRIKPATVHAYRLERRTEIQGLDGGTSVGNPGDWLVTGLGGEQKVYPDERFRRLFEPADESARRMFGSAIVKARTLKRMPTFSEQREGW